LNKQDVCLELEPPEFWIIILARAQWGVSGDERSATPGTSGAPTADPQWHSVGEAVCTPPAT
jgi:hypothetical protein